MGNTVLASPVDTTALSLCVARVSCTRRSQVMCSKKKHIKNPTTGPPKPQQSSCDRGQDERPRPIPQVLWEKKVSRVRGQTRWLLLGPECVGIDHVYLSQPVTRSRRQTLPTRQTDRQTGRQTDGQTDRQTERQTFFIYHTKGIQI